MYDEKNKMPLKSAFVNRLELSLRKSMFSIYLLLLILNTADNLLFGVIGITSHYMSHVHPELRVQ